MPHTFDENFLRALVSHIGEVTRMDFRPSRPLADGSPSTCFAFVEFKRPDQVDAAVREFVSTLSCHSSSRFMMLTT